MKKNVEIKNGSVKETPEREIRDLAEEETYNEMVSAGIDPDKKISVGEFLTDTILCLIGTVKGLFTDASTEAHWNKKMGLWPSPAPQDPGLFRDGIDMVANTKHDDH